MGGYKHIMKDFDEKGMTAGGLEIQENFAKSLEVFKNCYDRRLQEDES